MGKYDDLLIRCSALGSILGEGRRIGLTDLQEKELSELLLKEKVTEKQKEKICSLIEKKECKSEFDLSESAKTYLKKIVREDYLDFKYSLNSKEVSKGNEVELSAIDFLNTYLFKSYKKNTIRLTNQFITGECDIETDCEIIDIKCSWSKETFPLLPEEGENFDYECQGRGYMMLYNRSTFKIAYCLMDTPSRLINLLWDNVDIHTMNSITLDQRFTFVEYKRDFNFEEKIMHKVKECRRFANWYHEKIINKNK